MESDYILCGEIWFDSRGDIIVGNQCDKVAKCVKIWMCGLCFTCGGKQCVIFEDVDGSCKGSRGCATF